MARSRSTLGTGGVGTGSAGYAGGTAGTGGTSAPATPVVHAAKKGGRKVTVASKMPMDLVLQLTKPTDVRVTGQFGSTTEVVHQFHGPTVTIRGTSYPSGGQVPKGFPKPPGMLDDSGYALTPTVDADFFELWLKQNAETLMVQNGLIKGGADIDDLAAEAMEFAKVRTGLEPLMPDSDPRNPRPINTAVAKISTDDRQDQRSA